LDSSPFFAMTIAWWAYSLPLGVLLLAGAILWVLATTTVRDT